jgi:sodium transport system permease protein
MFDSEEILFGNKASFSFLEKRSNIKKGNMPSASDGVILYAISLVLLIYVGSIVQMKLGLGGLALTQIMIIGLPLLFAFYIKLDFKKVFSIKIPKIKHIIASILLWGSAYILVNLSSQVLLHIFPQNIEIIENLNHTLYQDKFLINLLVIALMPAICEEMLFRGFIFTSFKSKKGVKMAIIGSAILFGFMHIDFIRIIPTSILGINFAFAVYKSESIFVSMLMHFINNGLVVFAMHYPKNTLIKSVENLTIFDPNLNVLTFIGLLAISIILLIVSLYLFKKAATEKSESTI